MSVAGLPIAATNSGASHPDLLSTGSVPTQESRVGSPDTVTGGFLFVLAVAAEQIAAGVESSEPISVAAEEECQDVSDAVDLTGAVDGIDDELFEVAQDKEPQNGVATIQTAGRLEQTTDVPHAGQVKWESDAARKRLARPGPVRIDTPVRGNTDGQDARPVPEPRHINQPEAPENRRGELAFAARIQLTEPLEVANQTKTPGKGSGRRAVFPDPQFADSVDPIGAVREDKPAGERNSEVQEKSRPSALFSAPAEGTREDGGPRSLPLQTAGIPLDTEGGTSRIPAEKGPVLKAESTKTPIIEPEVRALQITKAPREIQLSVSGGEDANVYLKLVERAGKLQVAVRSPNAELTSMMQQDISRLVSRLGSEVGATDHWTPGHDVSSGDQDLTRGAAAGSHGFSDSGDSQDAESKENRRQHQEQERPDWVAELLDDTDKRELFQKEVMEWLKSQLG